MKIRYKIVQATLLSTSMVMIGLAQAQATSSGLALYDNNCQSCHGTPPNLRDGAGKGSGNASAIRNAINRNKGGMGYLSFLSDQQLIDIASYLANPSAATTSTPTPSLPPDPQPNPERILNWAEYRYASVLQTRETSSLYGAITYRCYMQAALCVGIDDQQVYLYEFNNPAKGIYPIGSLNFFLSQAQSDGF